LKPLAGRRVAVWGLTYKPGTDTLRRSLAVELCRWLLEQGAQVQAHDPGDSSWHVEYAEFLEDIALGRPPAAGLGDALAALEIVEKIYAESGYDYHA
jgi:UDP-glucose 6-dehydrogenase